MSTDLSYRIQLASKKDQPIETSSENFSEAKLWRHRLLQNRKMDEDA